MFSRKSNTTPKRRSSSRRSSSTPPTGRPSLTPDAAPDAAFLTPPPTAAPPASPPPAPPTEPHPDALSEVETIVGRLLGPTGGCAWCHETTPAAVLRCLQGELVEVAEEIDTNRALAARPGGDAANDEARALAARRLEDEVGDCMFNLALMVGLCARDSFGVSLKGAAARICAKIERRCPYVFGDETAEDTAQAEQIWQRVKAEEKAATPVPPPAFEAAVAEAEQGAADGDVVVLVAKFPTRGKTKTRMMPALGEDGAYELSLALVRDALTTLGTSPKLAAA